MATDGRDSEGCLAAQPTKNYFGLWTVEECAEALMMAPGTLRNLGKRGPAKVKLGGKVYYLPTSVERWLGEQET